MLVFAQAPSRTDHAISWFVPDGSQGDHGMNHRFRPLACFLTLAMFAVLSSDGTAHARNKQTSHAKKAHEAKGERHHRHAASKKRGRGHSAAARREPSDDAERAAAPALTG